MAEGLECGRFRGAERDQLKICPQLNHLKKAGRQSWKLN